MSDIALKATICCYLDTHNYINYVWQLKRDLKAHQRWDLLQVLDDYPDFAEKLKVNLFNKRICSK